MLPIENNLFIDSEWNLGISSPSDKKRRLS